jgi:hypothetical protein
MIGITMARAADAASKDTDAEADAIRNALAHSPFDYFVIHILSNLSFTISFTILIVGMFTVILQTRTLKMAVPAPTPNDIMRITCVTLIITFGLALAAIFDAEDLLKASPIFGLFSTIAGYLLGSSGRSQGSSPANPGPTATITEPSTNASSEVPKS